MAGELGADGGDAGGDEGDVDGDVDRGVDGTSQGLGFIVAATAVAARDDAMLDGMG